MPKTILKNSAQTLIVGWANGQDNWIRGIVAEIIETRRDLTDERIEDFYQMFLREKELAAGDAVNVPPLVASAAGKSQQDVFSVKQLRDIEGVNALAVGQNIDFNSRMTVLFGENASGKTGYVRILKRCAGSRTAEAILPNVIAPTGETISPSARIAYVLNGEEKPFDWRNELGCAPFNRMDVFDSSGALAHLETDLTYIYTPGELSMFPMIQRGIEKVRQRLDTEIANTSPKGNPFIASFDRGTKQFVKVETLGAATNLDELRTLGTFNEEDKSAQVSLAREIDALQSSAPQAQLRLAQNYSRLLEELQTVLTQSQRFSVEAYNAALEEVRTTGSAYEHFTRTAFEGSSIPQVLGPEWSAFIQAGEEYIRSAHSDHQYPADNDKCVYCRQALDAVSVQLISKYREYLNNDFRDRLERARTQLTTVSSSLNEVNVTIITKVEEHLKSLPEGTVSPIADSQPQLKLLTAMKLAVVEHKTITTSSDTLAILEAVKKEGIKVLDLIQNLSGETQERETLLKEKRAVSADFAARAKMSQLLPQIEGLVQKAKWTAKAGVYSKGFQSIFRTLTETSKAASQQLLNQDFEERFQQECQNLRAPKVKLDFPGREGQTLRRKSVASNHKPSQVLSEGEQKVIALADFLAEIGLKPSSAPIVFDDPINSLDYKRMAEVVQRLIQLSEKRQVIVFTHNIWFACLLLAEFEKDKDSCSYYDVTADGDAVGVITKNVAPRADSVKTSIREVKTLIQDAEKVSGTTQTALAEKGYDYLRNLCEAVIEMELLSGVTQRYQPNVMMGRLSNIKFDRLKKSVEATNTLFEKCCRFIRSHSQPLETLNIKPSLTELKADLASLEAILAEYRKA